MEPNVRKVVKHRHAASSLVSEIDSFEDDPGEEASTSHFDDKNNKYWANIQMDWTFFFSTELPHCTFQMYL